MGRNEKIRWLRPQSQELRRRHLLGWVLVLGLGALVGAGVAAVNRFGLPVMRANNTVGVGLLEARPQVGAVEDRAPAPAPEPPVAQVSEAPPVPPAADPVPEPAPSDSTGGLPAAREESPAALAPAEEGWWIVLGSFPESSPVPEPVRRRVVEGSRRCGAEPVVDLTARFDGFAPGYQVYIIGALADRAAAEQVLRRLRPCVPDAYLKRAKRRAPAEAASGPPQAGLPERRGAAPEEW